MSPPETQSPSRPEPLALAPRSPRSRTGSLSSDRPSAKSFGGFLSPLATISPEPVYIAPSAASQIVTNDHDSRSDTWFDQHGVEPSGETVLISQPALKLVNSFLDQLLLSFLSVARSTSLTALRPAVSEILKPKLAKDAIAGADLELQEYLGGGEDEEVFAFHNGVEASGDWDVELAWKRTRLRCMVYSSLGDMEEEDEDYYTEQEQLEGAAGSRNHFPDGPGIISPAVAIFLTSILEFMGEQALIIAGQAAYHRLQAKQRKDERDGTMASTELTERVIVDEMDMERVALDRTLGRLWRGWKKRIRSPSISMSRSFSRDSLRSKTASRRGSSANETQFAPVAEVIQNAPKTPELREEIVAANIPLPISDDDVREIEIPGLAVHSDDESTELSEPEDFKIRPQSLTVFPQATRGLPTPDDSRENIPLFLSPPSRKRSYSEPHTSASAKVLSLKKYKASPAKADADKTDATTLEDPFRGHNPDKSTTTKPSDIVSNEIQDLEDGTLDTKQDEGPIASVLAGAATIGASAVALSVEGPSKIVTEEGSDDESVEEPEIMTSSRISVGSSHSPDGTLNLSRHSSARAGSVHSLRLVDVPARSPSVRREPVDDPFNIVGAIQRASRRSPLMRSSSTVSLVAVATHDSISEEEHREELAVQLSDRSPLRDSSATIKGRITQDDENQTAPPATDNPIPHQEPQSFYDDTHEPSPEIENVDTSFAHRPMTGVQPMTVSKASNHDSGAPPLTPLREMMEGAPDTADEASSIALSDNIEHDSFSKPSPQASTFTFSKTHSNESSKPVEQSAKKTTIVETTLQYSPKQVQRDDDSLTPKPDVPGKDYRQLQSSSSNTSSTFHKLIPRRTSEDSVAKNGSDRGRSLEELIQSDETIQYTLTPRSMRKIEFVGKEQKTALPPLPTLNTSVGATKPRKNSHSSIANSTGLHSTSPVESLRSIAARDARVESPSMGELVDFIRTTGPPGPPPVPEKPRIAHKNVHAANSSRVGSAAGSPNVRRSTSSAVRRQMQAREAVVPRSNSADLIDFIRQGPPSANSHDNPRFARNISPFRNTMDSDQMSGAVIGRPLETIPDVRYSQASTNASNEQSVQSSANSQSALLAHSSPVKSYKSATRYSSIRKPDPQPFNAEEDMMPKRKQTRVRDPYAIDYSDEEEDDEFTTEVTPKKPIRREESLIEFLNSAPPPESPVRPTPIASAPPKPIGKKASSHSLMSRFSRSGSISQAARSTLTKVPSTKSHASTKANGTPQAATQIPAIPNYAGKGGAATSTHLPSQTSPANKLGSERRPVTAPRTAQQSYQPREAAIPRRTQAQELADFFANTAPPPSMTTTVHASPPPEQKGFSRIFGRRKKVAAV